MIPRVAILVQVVGDDLEKVNEAEGDAESGKRIKLAEIEREIHTGGLHYRAENTLFLNSLEGIETGKESRKPSENGEKPVKPQTVVREFDEEAHREAQLELRSHLSEMLQRFRGGLEEEAFALNETTEKLYREMRNPSLEKQHAEALAACINQLEGVKSTYLNGSGGDGRITEKLGDYTWEFFAWFRRAIHWRTAKKTTDEFGMWFKAELYSEIYADVEKKLDKELAAAMGRINGLLSGIEAEELKPFRDSCIRAVTENYLAMRKDIPTAAKKLALTAVIRDGALDEKTGPSYGFLLKNHDPAFWDPIQTVARQGGTGFYDSLVSTYNKRFERKNFTNQVIDMAESKVGAFFDDIISLLKEKQEALLNSVR